MSQRIGNTCRRQEFLWRFGNHQLITRHNDRATLKRKVDSCDAPFRQVHVDGHLIVQFDPFQTLLVTRIIR